MPFKGNVPWNKGLKRPPFSEEWKENMAKAHQGKSSGMLGKHHSEDARNRIAETLKRIGHTAPTPIKMERISKTCPYCKTVFWGLPRQIQKRHICSSKWCRGMRRRTKFCTDCGHWPITGSKGKRCRSCWKKWCIGENAGAWKGGVTPINKRARGNRKAVDWRKAVFVRDDYTCQLCNVRGGKLQAHHIKKFADYPELRYEVPNGETLCEKCHKKTPNYSNKGSKHQSL